MPSLTIRKVYFDAILNGSKRHEYRSTTPYYRTLFRKIPPVLHLHYYRPRILRVEVVGIRTIPASRHLISLGFTPEVYEIELINPRLIKDEI